MKKRKARIDSDLESEDSDVYTKNSGWRKLKSRLAQGSKRSDSDSHDSDHSHGSDTEESDQESDTMRAKRHLKRHMIVSTDDDDTQESDDDLEDSKTRKRVTRKPVTHQIIDSSNILMLIP